MSSSEKLTKTARRRIADAVLLHRFRKDIFDLCLAHQALARKVYEAAFSVEDREVMASLPDGWLPAQSDFYADIGGGWVQLSLGRPDFLRRLAPAAAPLELPVEYSVPLPYVNSRRGAQEAVVALTEELPLAREYAELCRREARLQEAWDDLKAQVDLVLSSVSTAARLVQVWPEAAPFVAAGAQKKRQAGAPGGDPPSLPSVVAGINAQLPELESHPDAGRSEDSAGHA